MRHDRKIHPTAYEVAVGDRDLPIVDMRQPARGLRGVLRRFDRMRARVGSKRVIDRVFDLDDAALAASTTLVDLLVDDDGFVLRMTLEDGTEARISTDEARDGRRYLFSASAGRQHLADVPVKLDRLKAASRRDGHMDRILAKVRSAT